MSQLDINGEYYAMYLPLSFVKPFVVSLVETLEHAS